MATRFCIVPDPILDDGSQDDVHEILRPDDPELPHMLGRSGIASTAVYETSLPWEELEQRGFPEGAVKTAHRVAAAPGYVVDEESDFR